MTDDLHALQDAMRLKEVEIDRLEREKAEMGTMLTHGSRPGIGQMIDTRSTLDIHNPQTQSDNGGGVMALNVEL